MYFKTFFPPEAFQLFLFPVLQMLIGGEILQTWHLLPLILETTAFCQWLFFHKSLKLISVQF